MHRVTRSNAVGGATEGRDRSSTWMANHQGQGTTARFVTAPWHVRVRANQTNPDTTRRNLRPYLSTNWRANTTQNSDSDNEDHIDTEQGRVSIVPTGMRPRWAWVYQRRAQGMAANTQQHQGSDEGGASDNSQGTPVQTPRPFIPSNAVLGHPPALRLDNVQNAAMAGITLNPNYRGSLSHYHIENADTTAEENCSVRVHGIDPKASIKEILDTVRTGKVYSVNRCPPEAGVVGTAAADIVFVTRLAAESYLAQAARGIYIRGKFILAGWNRNRAKEAWSLRPEESRVIRIKGPERRLSVPILEAFFGEYFQFELVRSKVWRSGPRHKTFELEFQSIRPQATWAKRVFGLHFEDADLGLFNISFGPDPCDAGNLEANPNSTLNKLSLPWRRDDRLGDVESYPYYPPLRVGQAEW